MAAIDRHLRRAECTARRETHVRRRLHRRDRGRPFPQPIVVAGSTVRVSFSLIGRVHPIDFPMQYTTLGTTGITVSRISLGCMSYGNPKWRAWVLDQTAAQPFFRF